MKDFHALIQQAHVAGLAALEAEKGHLVPMVVVQADVISGQPLPNAKRYHVAEGPCGFAWVWFPGNKPFGKFMKKMGYARSAYPRGLSYWVSEGGQSLQLKEAYARAYAKVLKDAGVEGVYADSRMD